METSTKTFTYQEISGSRKLLEIAHSKILGQKKDYFLRYKYEMIQHYYGSKCLDIGAGNGSFSQFLSNQGHQVKAIDVVDKSGEGLAHDVRLFDGEHIPYADNSFDTSVLMFVLHHTNKQQSLISDSIRVTKNHIIIAEDVIQNRFDALLGAIHLNTSPWDKGHDSFRSHSQWKDFFLRNNLELSETVTISRWAYPVYPVARKIYVLKVHK